MSTTWWPAVAVLCATTAPAAAERAVDVVLATEAPFRADELAAALRMRLPATGPAVYVRVARTPLGIRVDVAGESRDVALAGRSGAEAARLVALAATDLMLGDLAMAPDPAGDAPGLMARGPVPGAVAPRRALEDRWTIGTAGSAMRWSTVLAAGALEVTAPVGGVRATAELAGGSLLGGDVGLLAAVARVGAGVRVMPALEVRAGVTIAPVLVQTGAGDQTVLAGGNASVRLRLPVSSSTRIVVAAGADVFATRTAYVLDGATVMTTPRISPWLAAGVEVAL